ncbi:MAG: outer membrane beta-barrel protein [Flavobacteriales bacterium]|nr:outer membrane beta-barrel protein [Flavobacteriales bacterium]
MRVKLILFYFLLVCSHAFFAQERVTTFGVQFKPIITSELFNTGKQEIKQNNVTFGVEPLTGYSFGMVIRKGMTKNLSLESGINYLNRKFELSINDQDTNFLEKSKYNLVNYEIPISLLVYIRLSEYIFMNVSGGLALDIYPSDLYTYSENFQNDVLMYDWIRPSLIANIGWEYRTDKSGYIYLGASYHRPFSHMAKEVVLYNGNRRYEKVELNLSGNYITVDIRYFFHEDAEKKKRKVKKSKPLERTK